MSNSIVNFPRVLIVDDNQDAASSLAVILKAAGYEVATSFEGQTALRVAEQFKPDACVLDINMPGMNGYELARHLRKNAHGHLVLATLTAYSDMAHLDRAVDSGFDLHFTKPVDPCDLAEQLADCLGQ